MQKQPATDEVGDRGAPFDTGDVRQPGRLEARPHEFLTERVHVRAELEHLNKVRHARLRPSAELTQLTAALKDANSRLWDIEDDIRRCEAAQDFGPCFVELARSVYRTNDQRADLKRAINQLLNAAFVEQKSYVSYQ